MKFAAKFNCEVFSKEERRKSNVAGTHGKEKLDMNIIAAIRDATFLFIQLILGSSTLSGKGVSEQLMKLAEGRIESLTEIYSLVRLSTFLDS